MPSGPLEKHQVPGGDHAPRPLQPMEEAVAEEVMASPAFAELAEALGTSGYVSHNGRSYTCERLADFVRARVQELNTREHETAPGEELLGRMLGNILKMLQVLKSSSHPIVVIKGHTIVAQ